MGYYFYQVCMFQKRDRVFFAQRRLECFNELV